MSSHDEDGSGRFEAVDGQYEAHAVKDRVFDYWEAVDAYEQTVEHRADTERYFFVDGPPYRLGAAHIGTTWNKTLKDASIRYLRMCGYDVTDWPGYDIHCQPIETKVEERLEFGSKKDTENFGEEKPKVHRGRLVGLWPCPRTQPRRARQARDQPVSPV